MSSLSKTKKYFNLKLKFSIHEGGGVQVHQDALEFDG